MKSGKPAPRKSRRSSMRPLSKLKNQIKIPGDNNKPLWQAFAGETGRADKVPIQWEKFESTMGFNIEKHMGEFFSKVDISEASKHRRTYTKLIPHQSFVTDNYTKFIRISNEIMNIEGDMAKLTSMLGAYKGIMKHLQSTSFDFSQFDTEPEDAELQRHQSSMLEADTRSSILREYAKSDKQKIENICEEVGILVYQCKYGEAVEKISEARDILKKPKMLRGSENSAMGKKPSRILKEMVDRQVRSLVTALFAELRRTQTRIGNPWSAGDIQVIRIIRYLRKLGRSEEALEILLKTRSSALKAEVRCIKFQGDAGQYIPSLSRVVFRGIGLCVEEFRSIFPENRGTNPMMAAVVQWVIEELEDFVGRFNTQMAEAQANFFHLAQCLRAAFQYCKKLDTEGLNLTFVLARRLLPIVQQVINRGISTTITHLQKKGGEYSKESWLSKKKIVKDEIEGGGDSKGRFIKKNIKLTTSGSYLYNAIRTLLEGEEQLSLVINEDVSKSVIKLLDTAIMYQVRYATHSLSPIREKEHLSIIANLQFLLADLLPRVRRSIEKLFHRNTAHEVVVFEGKLTGFSKHLLKSFCKRRAEIWLDDLKWNKKGIQTRYGKGSESKEKAGEENLSVSPGFLKVIEKCYILMDNIATHLRVKATKRILGDSFEVLFRALSATDLSPIPFSRRGLQQLYLDVSFLLKAASGYMSEDGSLRYARSLIRNARVGYCKRTGEDEAQALNSKEYFEERIVKQMASIKRLDEYEPVDKTSKKRRPRGHTASSSSIIEP
ncbi:hypothetical protein AAMO2058_001554000 [Amorphochlora amoebiformis]